MRLLRRDAGLFYMRVLKAFNKFTRVSLFAALIAVVPATALAIQCEGIFILSSSQGHPLLTMAAEYRGEDRGLYMDPITKKPWFVKYFSESEKQAFELFVDGKILVNREGVKVDSVYDPEAMSFETSLIVIDKNHRMFLLPFEERGVFHHSSLGAGEDVFFAGTASFGQGVLREFTGGSGHYKPSVQQTLLALQDLRKKGVDLSNTKLTGRIAKELTGSYVINPSDLKVILDNLSEP